MHSANEVFDLGKHSGGETEGIGSHAEKEACENGVCGNLAADADGDLRFVSAVDDGFQCAEDCGMGGFIEVGDAVVEAIDGDEVLNQVVCADAEEVAFACE